MGFVLRFTLLIYLTTSKIFVFRSIIFSNADFQITFDKIAKTGFTLF